MTRWETVSNRNPSRSRLLPVGSTRAGCTLAARNLLLSLILLTATLTAVGTKKPPQKPVDINRATTAELEQVPGIGHRTAEAIVHLRQKSGPYKHVDDLLAIRGISHTRLERLRPYLTVGDTARAKTK